MAESEEKHCGESFSTFSGTYNEFMVNYMEIYVNGNTNSHELSINFDCCVKKSRPWGTAPVLQPDGPDVNFRSVSLRLDGVTLE